MGTIWDFLSPLLIMLRVVVHDGVVRTSMTFSITLITHASLDANFDGLQLRDFEDSRLFTECRFNFLDSKLLYRINTPEQGS
jgi:hypothetical protein